MRFGIVGCRLFGQNSLSAYLLTQAAMRPQAALQEAAALVAAASTRQLALSTLSGKPGCWDATTLNTGAASRIAAFFAGQDAAIQDLASAPKALSSTCSDAKTLRSRSSADQSASPVFLCSSTGFPQ